MDLTNVRFQGTTPQRLGGTTPCWAPSATAHTATAIHEATSAPVSGLPWFVLERAGLDPTLYRENPLRRRTAACLRAMRADSERTAFARLESDDVLVDTALNALLIGVSDFFRDPMVFRTLQSVVIQTLATRLRPLRVASVGCSSGAELYSMAMLLAQAGLLHRSDLLGIDCRPSAVDFARAGRFADLALSALDNDLRRRYFDSVPGGGRVVASLRQQTAWRAMDATRECPPGPWDVVLCRNLVIYLQDHAGQALFDRLTGQLARGGFLVVGNAERPPASLKLTQVARCVYQTHDA
jgi:chemotaxis protein methyltransferase CheR